MVFFYFQAVLNLFMLVPSLKMQVPRIFFMAPGLLFPILDWLYPILWVLSPLSWSISDSLKGWYGGGSGETSGKRSIAIKEENVGNQFSCSFCFNGFGYGFPDFNWPIK